MASLASVTPSIGPHLPSSGPIPSVLSPTDARINEFVQGFYNTSVNTCVSTGLAGVMAIHAFCQCVSNLNVVFRGVVTHSLDAWTSLKHYVLDAIQSFIQFVGCTLSSVPLLNALKLISQAVTMITAALASAFGIVAMGWIMLREAVLLRKTKVMLADFERCFTEMKEAESIEKAMDSIHKLVERLQNIIEERENRAKKLAKGNEAAERFLKRYYVEAYFQNIFGVHGYQHLRGSKGVLEQKAEEPLNGTVALLRHLQTALHERTKCRWINVVAAVSAVAAIILGMAVPVALPLIFVGYALWGVWLVCTLGECVQNQIEKRYFQKEDQFYEKERHSERAKGYIEKIKDKIIERGESDLLRLQTLYDPGRFAQFKSEVAEALYLPSSVRRLDGYFSEALKGVVPV